MTDNKDGVAWFRRLLRQTWARIERGEDPDSEFSIGLPVHPDAERRKVRDDADVH